MSTEKFTKKQFEDALPTKDGRKAWEGLGIREGEWVYAIPIGEWARLVIRSSVGGNGIARDSGEDSIRLWAEVKTEVGTWKQIAKIDGYTTRVSGWPLRLYHKIWELQAKIGEINQPIPVCQSCKKVQGVWVIKSGKHEGRLGSKCFDCDKGLVILAQPGKGDSGGGNGGDNPHNGVLKKGGGNDDLFGEIDKWLEETVPIADAQESPQQGIGTEDGFTSAPTTGGVRLTGDGKEISKFGLTLKGNPNPQQEMAINADQERDVRLLAGPGSGKTFTLTRRYGFLLANGVLPSQVLMVTFNKTMADEMLAKVIDLYPHVEGTSAAQQICTIHALCYRLLKETKDSRQVPKDWQIKKIIQEASEDIWPIDKRPSWEEVLGVIGAAKHRGLKAGQDASFYSNWLGDYYGETIAQARVILDRQMNAQGLITFGDMMYEIERLIIENNPIVETWRNRYKHIMVDEGQDTNGQAMRILAALGSRAKMYIVGDADQLLYRFTGATPEDNLYDGFDNSYPNGITYMLETNYRSNAEIIARCNRLIGYNYADKGGPYEERFKKNLQPRENAPTGESSVTLVEYGDPEIEAMEIAKSIKAYMDQGRKPGDFFVGSRTRAQLGYLEGPMMALGIPFVNITGGSFWQQKHIQDVFAYLKLAYNQSDQEAFKRVYNIASENMITPWGKTKGEYCNHRFLGAQFLQACDGKFENVLSAARQRNSYRAGVEDLSSFVQELVYVLDKSNMSETLEYIVEHCYIPWLKVEEGLQPGDEAEKGKLSDLGTMIELSKKFKTVEDMTTFIDKAIEASEDAKKRNWNDYVVLSTIHRLKGLERPIVYGPGWSEGVNPQELPVGLLPHTFSLTEPPQMGVLNLSGMARIEDERCIAFVLLSRAMEVCHLSTVKRYRNNTLGPSRFLVDLGLVDASRMVSVVEGYNSYEDLEVDYSDSDDL